MKKLKNRRVKSADSAGVGHPPAITADRLYATAGDIFPICRSLTGDGVRETLAKLAKVVAPAELRVQEVPSGKKCLDWNVPNEWNIRDAYIADASGNRIVDFRASNLHVAGYSQPIDVELSLEELQKHLFSLPDQPDAIPYITSYYSAFWGFCLTDRQRKSLKPGKYRAVIDSTLAPGSLTYGEILIKGKSKEEVFLSTYVCHPSMANNEVSGPVVCAYLAQWLAQRDNRLSYRIVFVPETIGAIVYLSRNLKALKSRTIAGFQVTCVGDDRAVSFLPSRLGGTLADRAARHVLERRAPGYKSYSFLDRGSDERQYCSPGVDLPLVSIMRSKYATYPEYHTSLDNMDFISGAGLHGAFEIYRRTIEALETNRTLTATCLGEPQLGKRGLYPNVSTKESLAQVELIGNVYAYCDGAHDLLSVAELIGAPIEAVGEMADKLQAAGLLRPAK